MKMFLEYLSGIETLHESFQKDGSNLFLEYLSGIETEVFPGSRQKKLSF